MDNTTTLAFDMARNDRVAALAAQQQRAADDALAAMGDTEHAAAIAAVLAADDGDDNAREGREVAWFDGCDAVDKGDRDYAHAVFNVRKEARWQGVHYTRTANLLDVVPGERSPVAMPVGKLAQLAHMATGEVLDAPRLDAREQHGQLIADKYDRAQKARQTELDKLAFPYLWKADRKRGSLKSQQGFNAARQRMLDSLA